MPEQKQQQSEASQRSDGGEVPGGEGGKGPGNVRIKDRLDDITSFPKT
ncbi:hypothetical protein [Paenibacillus ihbetae]|nr:hypothetical protein [Paenibacillus ihbetae]